jgi:hypothetical protein
LYAGGDVRHRNVKIPTAVLIAVALTALGLLGQTLSDGGEARFAYNLTSQDRVPFWNGALVIIEHNGLAAPTIHSFDLTGAEMPPIVFAIPGANETRIERVAYGKDGTYAVCGRAFDANGKGGGFVAWISPDRQNTKVIQTFPYIPYSIVMTADGSTWTQGFEIAHGHESDPAVNLEHGSSGASINLAIYSRLTFLDPQFDVGLSVLSRGCWLRPRTISVGMQIMSTTIVRSRAMGKSDLIPASGLLIANGRSLA